MKSPLLPSLISAKVCDWYHILMSWKLINTFNTLKEWPTDQWPLLLQSILKAKAQEVYTTLLISECMDYDWVKNAILKAYELVPEAYRQKFRNYYKQESQTHVEFAHEKEVYFDRWCNSREVGTAFKKLGQVILIEKFKRCVRDDIKTYLDE